MTLASGSKLGPYEIQAPLGAGGMGEVYHARDTRLGRDVAIKVLPQHLSSNPRLKERLEREALAISSLNHPHICTLYDVGHQDGIDFLVMEYLEGETLADRLEKGALPPEQVLRVGAEAAAALDAAHRRGVVHRDLKPGNIMLTKTGAKLMDFGLAKPVSGPAAAASLLTLTASKPLTVEGTIVGTFQYMAPEQVEGKESDARTDIFALGSVLYEMATGRRAFQGESQLSVVSAILEKQPEPITVAQPLAPPALEHFVRRALAKNPDERWQSASDLAGELKWIAQADSQTSVSLPVTERWTNRERILTAVALAGVVATVLLGVLYWNRAPADVHAIRAYIKPMVNSSFVFVPGGGFALSPDGLRLAYVASTQDGKSLLWVRPIDSSQAQPLAGTEGAGLPFWSPNSRFIGFFAGGKLKKIEASGGPPLTLCDVPFGRGGTWSREGVILFSPSMNGPLYRVSAGGGAATPATTVDASKNETSHRWPHFLPDGHHFLYLAGLPYAPRENPMTAIRVGSLDSKESKLLVYSHASAIYASGYILFLRQNTLMAQPFDAKRQELTGDALPIDDPVLEDTSIVRGVFSASENGSLTYVEGSSAARQLILVDRRGKKVGEVPGTETSARPSISPDGKRIGYTLSSNGYDVWSYDIARGLTTRLTVGSASAPANAWEVWSPDGRWIAYTCVRNGKYDLCRKPSDGSGSDEILLEGTEQPRYPTDWSPDGRFLAYAEMRPAEEIWMFPLTGEHKPFPFRQSKFSEAGARFSPNGKWLAYCSDESGEYKVYVVPFPGPGGKWQISPGGGCSPRWRRDGKEIS